MINPVFRFGSFIYIRSHQLWDLLCDSTKHSHLKKSVSSVFGLHGVFADTQVASIQFFQGCCLEIKRQRHYRVFSFLSSF